ncbi:MAG: hypothetical protein PUG69_00090 [Ruminococcus sp.]|nr:hypothetical protein [Ruminococcus sp.]MDY6059471.1 hypothetical protein [Candidatus Fimenecus sp.]
MSERQPKAVANDTKQTTTYRRDRARPCPHFDTLQTTTYRRDRACPCPHFDTLQTTTW